MNHYSIDLETLGTAPGCPILIIGIVGFNPLTDDLLGSLSIHVDLDSCFRHGMQPSSATIRWWMGQDDSARSQALAPGRPLAGALADLREYLEPGCQVWGNGATFDIAILEDAYRRVGEPAPWNYWNVRDVRTIRWAGEALGFDPLPRPKPGRHIAVKDAEHQARVVQNFFQQVRQAK